MKPPVNTVNEGNTKCIWFNSNDLWEPERRRNNKFFSSWSVISNSRNSDRNCGLEFGIIQSRETQFPNWRLRRSLESHRCRINSKRISPAATSSVPLLMLFTIFPISTSTAGRSKLCNRIVLVACACALNSYVNGTQKIHTQPDKPPNSRYIGFRCVFHAIS